MLPPFIQCTFLATPLALPPGRTVAPGPASPVTAAPCAAGGGRPRAASPAAEAALRGLGAAVDALTRRAAERLAA